MVLEQKLLEGWGLGLFISPASRVVNTWQFESVCGMNE
jgi:hypothetical protein